MHPKLRTLMKVLERAAKLEERLFDHGIRLKESEALSSFGTHYVHRADAISTESLQGQFEMSVWVEDTPHVTLSLIIKWTPSEDEDLHKLDVGIYLEIGEGDSILSSRPYTYVSAPDSLHKRLREYPEMDILRKSFRRQCLNLPEEDDTRKVDTVRAVAAMADAYHAFSKLLI